MRTLRFLAVLALLATQALAGIRPAPDQILGPGGSKVSINIDGSITILTASGTPIGVYGSATRFDYGPIVLGALDENSTDVSGSNDANLLWNGTDLMISKTGSAYEALTVNYASTAERAGTAGELSVYDAGGSDLTHTFGLSGGSSTWKPKANDDKISSLDSNTFLDNTGFTTAGLRFGASGGVEPGFYDAGGEARVVVQATTNKILAPYGFITDASVEALSYKVDTLDGAIAASSNELLLNAPDGTYIYVDLVVNGPVQATGFSDDNGNSFSSLFDGTGGSVLLSQQTGAIWDGGGYTATDGFFNGTAGSVIHAVNADMIWDGSDYQSAAFIFDGSGSVQRSNRALTLSDYGGSGSPEHEFTWTGTEWRPSITDDNISSYDELTYFNNSGFNGKLTNGIKQIDPGLGITSVGGVGPFLLTWDVEGLLYTEQNFQALGAIRSGIAIATNATAPAATDVCEPGDMIFTDTYTYRCFASEDWRRVAASYATW